MAETSYQDWAVALNRSVNSSFKVLPLRQGGFYARLMRLDMMDKEGGTYYGKKFTPRVQPVSIKGGKFTFNYWAGDAVTEGVDPTGDDFDSRELPREKNTTHFNAEMEASAYQGQEMIKKWELNRLKGDEAIGDLGEKTKDSIVRGHHKKLNADLFRTVTPGGVGRNAYDQIMAFFYPLQSGYADNELTGSGSYEYLGVDMNATGRTELKAQQVGTTSVPFVLSRSNLEAEVMNMREVIMCAPDICMLPKHLYQSLKDQGLEEQTTNRQAENRKVTFGTSYLDFDGIMVFWEPKLDELYNTEGVYRMALGCSDALRVGGGFVDDDTKASAITLIENLDGLPWDMRLQWGFEAAFVNERPYHWLHGYNVVAPS